MKRWLKKLHDDSRGAIGVLILLTIWCFVALIAMLWNTAEYSVRRQHVQHAADAAAHSAATWQSRTLNAITGQNMVICRDASAEAVWRAACETGGDPNHPDRWGGIYPKSGDVYHELWKERRDAVLGRTRVGPLQARLRSLVAQIEDEYTFLNLGLTTLQKNVTKANFKTVQDEDDYIFKLRQARRALDYVENDYLHGQAGNNLPNPPGPNGEGLFQLVDEWNLSGTKERSIFDLIVNYIDAVEIPIVAAFQEKTVPATATLPPLSQVMQDHELSVYQQEISERDSITGAIDQQVHRAPVARLPSSSNIEDFYNVDVKLGTTKQARQNVPPDVDERGLAGTGEVGAPVITAFEADGTIVDGTHGPIHYDTIRHSQRIIPYDSVPPGPITYEQQAIMDGLPLDYSIDPISPNTIDHTWANGTEWPNATIWHPSMPVYLMGQKIWINLMVSGGWGHLWLMPLERYLNDRIWRDQADLRVGFWVPLDKERNNNPNRPDLKTQIQRLQGLPPSPQISRLPRTISDDVADPQGVVEDIPVLPVLVPPTNSSGPFNSAVQLFNSHAGTYLQDIRELRRLLLTYTTIYEEFYVSFAANYWFNAVSAARDRVQMDLTDNGYFMILGTYKLRYLPPWARENMYATVREQVLMKIVDMNVTGITLKLAGNASATNFQQPAFSAVTMLTDQVVQQGYAEEITNEFLNRPWPYEFIPPQNPDGSRPRTIPLGIPKSDRQDYFSSVAVATDHASPRSLLQAIFGQTDPLVAYAQGETFNWMEFNTIYGGADQFDSPSYVPYYDFGAIACPRGWRLATPGGWNWQPRLSLSDDLPKALELNPDLQDALEKAGITTVDGNVLDPINLH